MTPGDGQMGPVVSGTRAVRVEQLRLMLSPMQRRVLELFLSGLTYEAMGDELSLGAGDVSSHMKRVREKFALCGLKLEPRRVVRHPGRVLPGAWADGRRGA